MCVLSEGEHNRVNKLTGDWPTMTFVQSKKEMPDSPQILDHPGQTMIGGLMPVSPPENQLDLPLEVAAQKPDWQQRAVALQAMMAHLGTMNDRYADRNLLILQLWADKHGTRGAAQRVSELARTSVWVVMRVLRWAKKGDYVVLAKERRAGRKGRRLQIIDALKLGAPPEAVAEEFGVHRTTVARALRQLNTPSKTGIYPSKEGIGTGVVKAPIIS